MQQVLLTQLGQSMLAPQMMQPLQQPLGQPLAQSLPTAPLPQQPLPPAPPLGQPLQQQPLAPPLAPPLPPPLAPPLQQQALAQALQQQPLGQPLPQQPLAQPLQPQPLGQPLTQQALGQPMATLPQTLPGLAAQGLLAAQYPLQAVGQLPQGLTFEQASQAYEQIIDATPEPEVTELVQHFKLDERIMRELDLQMKRRKGTIPEDIKALREILEGARNPAGLLRVKIREMEEGTFRGIATPDRDVEDLARKFSLDAQAAAKLAEVLSKRDERKKDIRQLAKHLELSNKPSSLVMLMLKDLRNGITIKDPEYPAAVGSYAHKRGQKKRFR
jgi:hypothetical protein